MEILIQVAQMLFILSVLVILHEFGHFIAARIFGVRVEKFYLFMDPYFSLAKKKIKDTEWGIGWLPIGGYVKLSGMIDESMDTEQMNQPAQEWEFRAKPAWQRLIIMLGGIIVNIVLAFLIYVVMFSTVGQKYASTEFYQKNGLSFSKSGLNAGFQNGDKIVSVDGKLQPKFNRMIIDILLSDSVVVNRNGQNKTLKLSDEQISIILGEEGKNFVSPRIMEPVIDSVLKESKSGLLKGDKLIKLNNKELVYFDEIKTYINTNKAKIVPLTVIRNGIEQEINAPTNKDTLLAIWPKLDNKDYIKTNKMSLGESINSAVNEAYIQFVYNIKQFKLILRPKTQAYKQVKSIIGITQNLPPVWDWYFVFSFMAMFSIGLAFMNLLPIPGLDGGHALFTIVEMVTGKTLSVKNAERVQTVGMVILLTLMVLTFGKDIYLIIENIFTKK